MIEWRRKLRTNLGRPCKNWTGNKNKIRPSHVTSAHIDVLDARFTFDASLMLNSTFAALSQQKRVIRSYEKYDSNCNRTLRKNW